jgi:hypothetical protein
MALALQGTPYVTGKAALVFGDQNVHLNLRLAAVHEYSMKWAGKPRFP